MAWEALLLFFVVVVSLWTSTLVLVQIGEDDIVSLLTGQTLVRVLSSARFARVVAWVALGWVLAVNVVTGGTLGSDLGDSLDTGSVRFSSGESVLTFDTGVGGVASLTSWETGSAVFLGVISWVDEEDVINFRVESVSIGFNLGNDFFDGEETVSTLLAQVSFLNNNEQWFNGIGSSFGVDSDSWSTLGTVLSSVWDEWVLFSVGGRVTVFTLRITVESFLDTKSSWAEHVSFSTFGTDRSGLVAAQFTGGASGWAFETFSLFSVEETVGWARTDSGSGVEDSSALTTGGTSAW